MTRLASINLIPKFTTIKGSKCQVCVQSKQPRKPHKAAEVRDLAPLELIHSDLCEINGVLTIAMTSVLPPHPVSARRRQLAPATPVVLGQRAIPIAIVVVV